MAIQKLGGFKPGDIVRLKSGGPEMTITGISYNEDEWKCSWFGGKKLEHGEFPPEAIEGVAKSNGQP